MEINFTFLCTTLFITPLLAFAQPGKQTVVADDCDRVQTLLNRLPDFQGALINDKAYECRKDYILEGFNEARVIVPGKEAKYWTVNMNTEPKQQVEAESKYLLLIDKLMKCVYLNSWKGGETIIEGDIYHYNFRQTINPNGYFKNILISYYKLPNSQSYKVEITLTN